MERKINYKPNTRPDREGPHRRAFERNKRIIYASRTVCGICGKPVDFKLKYPNPLSATIDHIIPLDRGGHPSDIDNLQLAHFTCNRQKSDKLMRNKSMSKPSPAAQLISNRNLPTTRDWGAYSGDE